MRLDAGAGNDAGKGRRARLAGLAALLLAMAALALAWGIGPLHDMLDRARLIAGLRGVADDFGLPAVLAVCSLALVAAVPLSVVGIVAGLALGPVHGPLLALASMCIAGSVSFLLGRWLGRDAVMRIAAHWKDRLAAILQARGVLAVALIRMVPVAPFAIVSIVLGSSPVRWTDFLLGTVLGLLPGLVVLGLVTAGLLQSWT